MKYLFICNTSSDCISKVNLDTFKEENKIKLNPSDSNKMGPHDICAYTKDKVIVANGYDNGISIVNIKDNIEENNYFIGMHCNDVVVYEDFAYIVCGETNNLVMFDLINKRVLEETCCGDLPHSIVINKEKKILLVSDLNEDSITLIDIEDMENVRKVRVGAYPTKAIFSPDGKYVYVCESNFGSDKNGSISMVSLPNLDVVCRTKVGNSPVDIFSDEKFSYVSNFEDGTVSILDMKSFNEKSRIIVNGMPRGIVKLKDCIYVGDYYNSLLIKYNLLNDHKENIPIGGEPTGILLI